LHSEGLCQYRNSISWLSVLDQIYFIHVSSGQESTFTASLSTTKSIDPCEGAELLSLKALAVHVGLTAADTNMDDAEYLHDEMTSLLKFNCSSPFDQRQFESPHKWYKVIGSNVAISLDSCSNPGFQPAVSMLEGSCKNDDLTCMSASYKSCTGFEFGTKVSWYAKANKTYYILVSGNREGESGNFALNFTSN